MSSTRLLRSSLRTSTNCKATAANKWKKSELENFVKKEEPNTKLKNSCESTVPVAEPPPKKRARNKIATGPIKSEFKELKSVNEAKPVLVKEENTVDELTVRESKSKASREQQEVSVKKHDINNHDLPISPGDTEKGKRVKEAVKGSNKLLGVHVSAEGGIHNAVANAAKIGCRSFALFLRNQRTWNAKPMDKEVAEKFRNALKDYGYSGDMVLPHGSYLLNAGSPEDDKLQKTRDTLLDEIQRCQELGITMYNFHPGSTIGKISVEDCVKKIAETINYVISKSSDVILVVETMACQGNTIGGKFSELKQIIDLVENKSRVGICLDTCHVFAAGYDMSTREGYDAMMKEFEETIGFQYLKAVHLNDSKGDCSSHLDRHEHIGQGKIGKTGFQFLMKDKRFEGIPMVLETPEGHYDREMITLYNLEHA